MFSFMDSNKSSGQRNDPDQISKIQNIIDIISDLQNNPLSKAQPSAPDDQSTQDNQQNNDAQTNGNDSTGNEGGNMQKDGRKSSEKNCWNACQPSPWASLGVKRGKSDNQQKTVENDARKIDDSSDKQSGNIDKSGNKSNKNHKQFNHSNGVDPLNQLRHDLMFMKKSLTKLKKVEDDFRQPVEELKVNLDRILTQGYKASNLTEQIVAIRKRCLNLKNKIPSAQNTTSTDSDEGKDLPNLCKDGKLEKFQFFREFQKDFEGLDIPKRLCLLCFAVFPEDALIKKRLLVHWWIGERLLDQKEKEKEKTWLLLPSWIREHLLDQKVKENTAEKEKDNTAEKEKVKTAEEIADELLQEFQLKRFIYSVDKKHRKVANSFMMYPHIRSAVIMLAKKAKFFDYDYEGIPTLNFQKCNRACLVYAEKGSIQERLKQVNGPNSNQEIRTLFNVSEKFPDFESDWFAKMKNIGVLYLGRWQSLDELAHVEVESTEYLKGLKNMQDLRLLSLQGISGIQQLPSSISSLTSLRVLDLRACYNLEKLPHDLGSLKNLTHLDISECYLLDGMPKQLSSLPQLQVFKGFVISDANARQGKACTLDDLKNLTQLRKLSISINTLNFQTEDLSTVTKFKELRVLRVIWGGGSSKSKTECNQIPHKWKPEQPQFVTSVTATFKRSVTRFHSMRNQGTFKRSGGAVIAGSDSKLEKLDLLCFPEQDLPKWLFPDNVKNLENLYIRGGQINSLGKGNWTQVKVLRLKFLNELKTDWQSLQELFPNLEYLEKFKCLKVTLCPCDGSGVWEKSKTENQSNANEEHAS